MEMLFNELCDRYMSHVAEYYGNTRRGDNLVRVVKIAREIQGETPVDQFGPKALKSIRDEFVRRLWTRKSCNDFTRDLIAMVRWGVEEELHEGRTLVALQAVATLKRGHTSAPESKKITALSQDEIDRVLKVVPRRTADMIRLQLLTGCRPGELLSMTPGQIDRKNEIWIYRPSRHKNWHREHDRAIAIGPQAQKILKRYLLRGRHELCFQILLTSYRRTIYRACDRVGIKRWSPNRLRHTSATRVRAEFGLEGAQKILGHRHARVSEVYAEQAEGRAAEIAAMLG